MNNADVSNQEPGKKNSQQDIIKPSELYFVDIGQIPRFWHTYHARDKDRSISKAIRGEKMPGGKFS
tara:strand:+ start:498 stop:695 length:198 start_codon:yes stop_codon:yes gene_type:complete